jgi:hypothetical protein
MSMHTKSTMTPCWAAVLLALCLSSCGREIESIVKPPRCKPGPVVFIIPDVSGSTETQTVIGGPYEQAMMAGLKHAARACGDVYSAPADGNAIGNGAWVIDGKTFRLTIGGSADHSAKAREQSAKELLPIVQRELRMRGAGGTDVLGAALRIQTTIDSLRTSRPIEVILITDGALAVSGAYSMYTTRLDTPARRRRFVAELARRGELPDYKWRAALYIAGLGIDLPKRDKARDIIRTWEILVPAMHARLRSADSTLRIP